MLPTVGKLGETTSEGKGPRLVAVGISGGNFYVSSLNKSSIDLHDVYYILNQADKEIKTLKANIQNKVV